MSSLLNISLLPCLLLMELVVEDLIILPLSQVELLSLEPLSFCVHTSIVSGRFLISGSLVGSFSLLLADGVVVLVLHHVVQLSSSLLLLLDSSLSDRVNLQVREGGTIRSHFLLFVLLASESISVLLAPLESARSSGLILHDRITGVTLELKSSGSDVAAKILNLVDLVLLRSFVVLLNKVLSKP